MRRLDRALVPSPPGLAKYQHGRHRWDDLSAQDRREVLHQLERLQGRLRAYCEASIDDFGYHVEHFRRRHVFPELTFAWTNLFMSCDSPDSCGSHKDRKFRDYSPDDLIDPSRDDPDNFLRFQPDGTISTRPGLGVNDRHRAKITLAAFNLDPGHGRLRTMRRLTVQSYLARDPDILKTLEQIPPEERKAYILTELAAAEGIPFGTTIRHLFVDV